ncbi:ACT domain-containing protein [Microvirga sp. 2YAF29]|uniref:ACT domain-containing protein n=1 Tax=Microvirga sp. 2YAF29 TaxID=3233031 RepID=UPI003F9B3F7A
MNCTFSDLHMPSLTLSLIPETYAICRLPAGQEVKAPSHGSFRLLVHAVEETTMVCPASEAPAGAQIDSGWRCFRILQNFDFSTPGILASVLQPLAQAGIGIFATSTFSTDYVLVKSADHERAVEVMREAGHTVEIAT